MLFSPILRVVFSVEGALGALSNANTATRQLIDDTVGWECINQIPLTLDYLKSINTNGTWSGNTYTKNGVTYIIETDNNGAVTKITANNTASANAVLNLWRNFTLSEKCLMNGITGGSATTYTLNAYNGTTNYYAYDGEDVELPANSYNYVALVVLANKTVNNVEFYPMVRKAVYSNITAFVPYHASVDSCKCDNSVISEYVEDGATCKNPNGYSVGEHFQKNGKFCTCIANTAQNETWTLNTNYVEGTIAENLNKRLPIINNAGEHNGIYRGKYLGSSVSADQYTAISNGTFDDLYIGDYWTIDGVNWLIAGFDYWLHTGDTECTTHHVVIVPETALYNAKMNNSNIVTGAYVGSVMYTTNLATAVTTINNAFGSAHILSHKEYLANAVTDGVETGGAWLSSTVELMNEIMVYVSNIFHNVINGTRFPTNYTIDKTQLALFRLDPTKIVAYYNNSRANWWLRDVAYSTYFAGVNYNGGANASNASNLFGVRPVFAIKA